MTLLNWLFGSKPALPGEFDPVLMRQAIDFMLKRIDPHLPCWAMR